MLKIIYDFDGTLTTSEMPQYEFLEYCKFLEDKDKAYSYLNKYAKEHNVSLYEAYYKIIFDALKPFRITFDDSTIAQGADKIKYQVGLEKYLKEYQEKAEHYIVTSGIGNYINHTKIAQYFKGIYGTTFEYISDGDVKIKDLVTDDVKIKKIDLIANNDYENIIYIGDGLTDIPAFKYVSEKGGIAILINSKKTIYNQIVKKGINVDYFKPSYKLDGDLVKYINDLIYLKKAEKFMKFKHGDQKRKQGTPYYTHPLYVAKLLKEKGFPIDYQVTGLFHDLLEDTKALNEEIFNYSNNDVLEAVILLTKEKGYDQKEYANRITNNEMARMVKLADRIHNLRDSECQSKMWQKKYYKETLEWYVPMAKGTVFEEDMNNIMEIIKERIAIK